ncbi:PspC domain-containing protein [Arthrobacter sp. zg-Y40]|uniref:PspC domain-containing protein n=1 Tax=Arthrobacter sp. zg-Y40 TaxID=2886939 RepID=UPI0022B0F2B4|nr:PspC domain-containing protein [Arthrobacter sp. zg-Y40]
MNPFPSSAADEPASASEQQPSGAGSASAGTSAAGHRPDGIHSGFFQWLRSLGVQRGPDRWFGGVASGLAAKTGLDPVLIRGLFVVLGVFGIGFLAYGLAWALLPEPDGRIHVEEALRGSWTSGMTGALVFTIVGMGGPGASVLGGDSWFGAVVWTLFWIGSGIAAIYWFSGPKGRAYFQGHMPHGTSAPAGGPEAADAGTTAAGTSGTAPVSLAKTGSPETPAPAVTAPAGTAGFGDSHGAPAGCTAKAAKVPGAGGPFLAALFGAALLAGGAILGLDYAGILPLGSPVSVALAAAAGVFGLGVVLLGLLGRQSGGAGTAAVVALAAALLAQGNLANANLVVASNADWTPQDSAQAGGGYTSVAANGTVDLRGTDLSGDTDIPVSVAAGNLNFLVPIDSPVTVRFGMAAGNIEVNDGGDHHEYSGLWQSTTERTFNQDAGGDPITIDVRGLAGNVLVTTEESDL